MYLLAAYISSTANKNNNYETTPMTVLQFPSTTLNLNKTKTSKLFSISQKNTTNSSKSTITITEANLDLTLSNSSKTYHILDIWCRQLTSGNFSETIILICSYQWSKCSIQSRKSMLISKNSIKTHLFLILRYFRIFWFRHHRSCLVGHRKIWEPDLYRTCYRK